MICLRSAPASTKKAVGGVYRASSPKGVPMVRSTILAIGLTLSGVASAERPLAIPGDAPPVQGPEQPHTNPGYGHDSYDTRSCSLGQSCTPHSEPPRRAAGGYVGLSLGATGLYGGPSTSFDLEAGFHIQRTFLLSATAGRTTDWVGRTGLTWVGVRPGIVFTPDQPLLVQADVLLGIGAQTYARDPRSGPLINVIEPRLSLGVPLHHWGQLQVYAGMRTVPGWQPESRALSAPTAGLAMRLGYF
ncbi:MAG: hypothetical protein EA397_04540 [Deltaproteobacteria bacterium]|nr:MAG: hypothetical protein EA397_04540 [Deltaproteobacteria bacterium]